MDIMKSGEFGPKLTSWKNEPSVRQLKTDLEAAKPSHDNQIAKVKRWSDLMKVEGSARPVKVKGRSEVQPKLIRRQAEWRYSALSEPFLSASKLYKISPTTFEDTEAAKQNEIVLNWQFRTKLNRVKFIDDFVRADVDEGSVIVRLGWKRSTKKVKKDVPVFQYVKIDDEEMLQEFQSAIQMKTENPRMFEENSSDELKAAVAYFEETQTPTIAEQVGTEPVTVEEIIENCPTLTILSQDNVWIDPSCEGDLNKAMFGVISFETSYSELLKEGKRYKNLDKVNWEGNSPLAQPDHATSTPDSFNFNDKARKRVVAYEYWGFYDIYDDGTLHPIVCTWIGDVMIRMEMNPFPDGKLPLVIVPYLPIKRELYGEPDAEVLEDNQKILGATMRGMIDLLGRSANGQQGFQKGMLDALNRRRYENGQDYEFNPNQNPNQGLIEHKYPEIPQSALLMINLQNQEAEALTGVKSFSGGLSGESFGDVAAGIRGVLDAASKREMSILRRLAKGMTEIGQKIIAMNAVFLSEEEVIRVTNEKFVKIRREDLKGNFDLEVDISTAEVDNSKANDLGFMLQTIGPAEDPAMRRMILAEIADLKRMPTLAHSIKTYQPQPDPMQQRLQELAIEKAELENEEIRSKIAVNQAKAKEVSATADQKNLDFVEQETGTKHARDLEKDGAQARGNQDLEVTKAFLKPRKPDESNPDIEAAVGYAQLSKTVDNAPSLDEATQQEELPDQTQFVV